MNEHFAEFNKLTHHAGNYLEQKLCYSLKTSHAYRRIWKQVREFMFFHGLPHYSKSVEEEFLQFKFQDKGRKDLTVNQRVTYNGVKMLTEYYRSGRINVPSQPSKFPLDFRGPIGEVVLIFLDHRQQIGISRSSLHSYPRHLYEFMEYCERQGIGNIEEIDLSILMNIPVKL